MWCAGEVSVEFEYAANDAGQMFPDDGGGGIVETIVGEEAAQVVVGGVVVQDGGYDDDKFAEPRLLVREGGFLEWEEISILRKEERKDRRVTMFG